MSVEADAPSASVPTPTRMLERRLVSVGGGLGSLAMAHVWRLAGVADDDAVIVGPGGSAADTYRYLARNSQIPDLERLRSDSGSTIDAIWGWPGYALRESVSDRRIGPALRVLSESAGVEFFTPRARQVYESVEREQRRLGWDRIHLDGWVRSIAARSKGGYTVNVDHRGGSTTLIFADHVHLAIGYPGVALLPDLQAFRSEHPDDGYRVVNAYEPHDHLYEELRRKPSTIVVRGSGIVASRVLQRLLDDVEREGAETQVVHLFRTYVDGPQGRRPWMRRPGGHGFAYQPFNYPKACWGGQLRYRLERTRGAERTELIDRMGGTNTAPRRSWRRQLLRNERSGAYRQMRGEVVAVEPADHGVATTIRAEDGSETTIPASYVLDATGLRSDPVEHPLYANLLATLGARRNAKGRLQVSDDFEIVGTRSGSGRIHASGAMTLGGAYAGVDSFLGLQYAALRIADDLAAQRALPRIGPWRSAVGWWRWARNRPYGPAAERSDEDDSTALAPEVAAVVS